MAKYILFKRMGLVHIKQKPNETPNRISVGDEVGSSLCKTSHK